MKERERERELGGSAATARRPPLWVLELGGGVPRRAVRVVNGQDDRIWALAPAGLRRVPGGLPANCHGEASW